MILGLGTDMIEISRIVSARERPAFCERVFTSGENARIAGRDETAAGIFAAKEAVAKALGTGFRGFGPDKIEIVWDELGKPSCRLSGGAEARRLEMGADAIHISITHSRELASAVAVAEKL